MKFEGNEVMICHCCHIKGCFKSRISKVNFFLFFSDFAPLPPKRISRKEIVGASPRQIRGATYLPLALPAEETDRHRKNTTKT